MSFISQKTAARIWQCYREIQAAEHLLSDMDALKEQYPNDTYAQNLKDVFGRSRNLQLGIPSGENSHRLFDVAPSLAESVIRAHISNKHAELVEANEQARIELNLEE